MSDLSGGTYIQAERRRILAQPVAAEELVGALVTQRAQRRAAYACGAEAARAPASFDCAAGGGVAVARADVCALEFDARLLGGGGVDEAVHAAAGPLLQRECAALPLCAAGDACITRGYRLPATFVVHTVAPYLTASGAPQPDLLRSCYRRVFAVANEFNVRNIAIPELGTGFYGFPHELAARIAVEESLAAVHDQNLSVTQVLLTLFKKNKSPAHERALKRALLA